MMLYLYLLIEKHESSNCILLGLSVIFVICDRKDKKKLTQKYQQ